MSTDASRGLDAFRAELARSRRLVIKIGSNQLVNRQTGEARLDVFLALAADIASLRAHHVSCILVTSGAVAFGRHKLGLPLGRDLALDEKQAAAAVGQLLLAGQWASAFATQGILTAQTLLSPDDTERRARWLNARNTVERLLDLGVLPVVNENDTVATQELRYGDNDRLAARVSQLAGADGLVLLSDVDGLYTADPALDPSAVPIGYIAEMEAGRVASGGPPRKGSAGTGGMASKLDAARLSASSGCWTVIARANDRPLTTAESIRLTFIEPSTSSRTARQAWVAGAIDQNNRLHLDAGAVSAVQNGRNLLPVGLTGVEGRFGRGETVRLLDPAGTTLAVGLAAYDSDECRALVRAGSREIESRLGYRRGAALVQARDIVLVSAEI